jgi:hypothetical protein
VKDRSTPGDADNPIIEAAQDSYWRESYRDREYVDPQRDYEYYRPAFRFGWQSSGRRGGRSFEELEPELRARWDPGPTGLGWEEARHAVRDAFERSATEWSDPGNPLA